MDRKIKDVNSFLKWVKDVREVENEERISFSQSIRYYRGQANKKWELKPSVFRHPNVQEHKLLHQAELELWNKMGTFRNYLDKLIYFQHYGLPTRLLDVTFNPLIALYMACDDEKERKHQGVVFVGYKGNEDSCKMTIPELTARFLFTSPFQNFHIELEQFAKKHEQEIGNFCQTTLIIPPINNPRIEMQNGAFIMSPLIEKANDCHLQTNSLDKSGFFEDRKALVPAFCKENILKELSELGINKGSIYRDTEKKLQSILRNEQWKNILVDAEAISEKQK